MLPTLLTSSHSGEVALHFAAKEKHCELLRLLVTAGASLNAQSRRGPEGVDRVGRMV